MQVRNGIKIIIFRDGKYIPHSQIHKWIGPDDDHGEEVYRNVNEGTGDSDNIWAADEGWVEIEKGLAAGAKTMMGLIPYEIEAMKAVVRDKITLFGSTNRA